MFILILYMYTLYVLVQWEFKVYTMVNS